MNIPEPRPATFGINVSQDVMIPTRDGTRLAADIYRPTIDGEIVTGPLPTILGRTSYDKTNKFMWIKPVADYFTPRGYAVVLQDLRGRYQSEGTGQYFHVANPLDGEDGYDTIEWIASQRWSNGNVGMVGSSHGAMTQTTAALERPPHLRAIWPDVGPISNFKHHMREGGAMALHMFGAQFLHAYEAQELANDPTAKKAFELEMANLRDWVWRTPFKRGLTPLVKVPGLEQTLFNYYTRGSYDEWWKAKFNDYERFFHEHADCAGTFSSGWYDPYAVATAAHFSAMAKQNTKPQRLILGPWNHESMRQEQTWAADVDFGSDGYMGMEQYNALRLQWFDRWLLGIENGVEDGKPVHIFVMGGGDGRRNINGKMNHGGQWRTEQEWPIARSQTQQLFFHSDGLLSKQPPETDTPARGYTFDPDRPVPTISANVTGFFELVPIPDEIEEGQRNTIPWRARMRSIVNPGGTHQRSDASIVGAKPPYGLLAHRADVLVYQTEPLSEPVEVTGPVTVKLWISSTAVDTDFTAKLVDVYPPNPDYPEGYHLNLVDSVIRCRYRDSWEEESLMEPGERYQVSISLPPTSNVFAAGHRIRVDISSSNFPRFDLNPNTGEPMGQHTHTLTAVQSVYSDATHASYLEVPIIPAQPNS